MQGRIRWLCSALLLAGACAGNAVRVEHAGEVAAAGSAATAKTGVFLDTLRAARREANVALVASDPSCRWGPQIVIRGGGGSGTALCVDRPIPARGDFVYSLAAIRDADLRPTLTLLAALSAYVDAVDAIVGGHGEEAHDNLAEALRGALAAQADVAAALGSRPLLSVEQADSAGKLIDMIGELHAEAGKVRRLRVVVAGQKVRVETLAGALKAQVKRWTDLSLRGDLQSTALAYARAHAAWEASGPHEFAERRDRIAALDAQQTRVDSADALARCTGQALDELAAADRTLIDALAGRYSAADRRQLARVTRARLLRALQATGELAGKLAKAAA